LKILPKRINRVYSITCIPKFDNLYCYDAWIINSDCRTILKKIPSETISLICTDPPHSDRIPYLELSELWNSILNFDVDFNGEIVVSDAKDRNKSKNIYFSDMTEFFLESSRILKPFGLLALYFNARDKESWLYLKNIEEIIDSLKFQGCFPMAYSATSIVQDNRKGALKNDYIIIFQKQLENSTYKFLFDFAKIPGWSSEFPQNNK
jgi:adenine-specific DNA methylase